MWCGGYHREDERSESQMVLTCYEAEGERASENSHGNGGERNKK